MNTLYNTSTCAYDISAPTMICRLCINGHVKNVKNGHVAGDMKFATKISPLLNFSKKAVFYQSRETCSRQVLFTFGYAVIRSAVKCNLKFSHDPFRTKY